MRDASQNAKRVRQSGRPAAAAACHRRSSWSKLSVPLFPLLGSLSAPRSRISRTTLPAARTSVTLWDPLIGGVATDGLILARLDFLPTGLALLSPCLLFLCSGDFLGAHLLPCPDACDDVCWDCYA